MLAIASVKRHCRQASIEQKGAISLRTAVAAILHNSYLATLREVDVPYEHLVHAVASRRRKSKRGKQPAGIWQIFLLKHVRHCHADSFCSHVA
jgi:hypothetical protein